MRCPYVWFPSCQLISFCVIHYIIPKEHLLFWKFSGVRAAQVFSVTCGQSSYQWTSTWSGTTTISRSPPILTAWVGRQVNSGHPGSLRTTWGRMLAPQKAQGACLHAHIWSKKGGLADGPESACIPGSQSALEWPQARGEQNALTPDWHLTNSGATGQIFCCGLPVAHCLLDVLIGQCPL